MKLRRSKEQPAMQQVFGNRLRKKIDGVWFDYYPAATKTRTQRRDPGKLAPSIKTKKRRKS